MFWTGLLLALPLISARPMAWSIPTEWRGQIAETRPKLSKKVIALTFDDGPMPGTTETILDSLKEYDIKATFFVTGRQAERHPAILQRMISEGHVVANHTWNHRALPSRSAADAEIFDTQTIIWKATKRKPNLFRPPYGIKRAETTKLARRSGMAIIQWTLTAADTGTEKWQDVYFNIVVGAKPGDIALFHDVKSHTAEALPKILRDLKKEGFRMVTIPEMLSIWSAAKSGQEGDLPSP